MKTQESWKEEIKTQITQFKMHMQKRKKEFKLKEEQLINLRQTELKHIQDVRLHYDKKLKELNQLCMMLNRFWQVDLQKPEERKRDFRYKRSQAFMKGLVYRRNSHYSTTPTSPECSPDSPQTVFINNSLVLF